jgi:hypothetical protein
MRSKAILGTLSEVVATQAPRWLMARSNPMLEGKVVQASSIELHGEASLQWRFRLRSLLTISRMRTLPLN